MTESNTIDRISTKRVLTFEEGCDYSGYKPSYMRKLIHYRIIPHSKPNGKSIFFEREKLEEWLLSNPHKGVREHKQAAANHISANLK